MGVIAAIPTRHLHFSRGLGLYCGPRQARQRLDAGRAVAKHRKPMREAPATPTTPIPPMRPITAKRWYSGFTSHHASDEACASDGQFGLSHRKENHAFPNEIRPVDRFPEKNSKSPRHGDFKFCTDRSHHSRRFASGMWRASRVVGEPKRCQESASSESVGQSRIRD